MHKFKLFIFVLLSLLLVVVFSTTALANTPPDIRPVNDPFGFTLPSADEGDTAYSAYFSALDPDGDPVTFSVVSKPSWLAFQDLGKNDAVLGLVFGQEIPEVIGQGPDYYYIDISAYDGVNPAVVETFCLPVVNIDQSPVADAGPDRSVYEGESVVLANDSYDVDGDILGYTWRAPAPITLNDVHVTNPTFTAPQVNADTDYEIILQVEDVVHNIIVADTVTITVVIVNQPPAWSSCNIALTEDSDPQVIDLNGYCNDPDGDSISYSPASGGDQATVAWSISGSELTLSVAENFNTYAADPIPVEITADDGNGGVTSQTLQVGVDMVNDSPEITTTTLGGFDNLVAGSGITYVTEIEFSDVDWGREGDSHTAAVQLDGEYAVQGDGKGIGTVTCTSGNPGTIGFGWTIPSEMVGSHIITVTVTDSQGASDAKDYDVRVRANRSPEFTSAPVLTVSEGDTYEYMITASDPDGNDLAFGCDEKPDWLGLTNYWNGTALLSGTVPEVNAEENFTIVLTLSDYHIEEPVRQEFTITVSNVNQPPAWSSCNIALTEDSDPQVIDLNGYCNDPDGDSISYSPASGGDQATVAWSISGSELTLDVADDFNTVGGNTIYIELIADDGNGGVTLQTLSVDVSPVNDPPVITTTTLGGFDNLVAGSIKEYDAEIEFSDVDWGREGDSHTAAVQLDGEDAVQGDGKGIGTVTCTSGNPGTIGFGWTIPSEMVGSHKIAVTVTDYQGASDTKEYDVEVRAIQPPRAVATATPDKTLANPGQTADITLDGSQSTDPDGNIVSYLWQEGITTVGAGVTPTVPFAIGTHAVTLTVTDDDGASATDDVVITVNENQPPIADAGENQVAGEGETVVLDGNESYDPDGSVVSYSWTVLSARITLKDADTATPSFVAPQVDLETNYEIMLIVGDDIGAISAADTIIVTVQDLSDVTTPRVNISLPAPDGENGYYITAPTLSIEVDDESSGIEWIRVEVNGNLHEFFPDPPAPLSWVESYIVSEDGTYDIKVKSQDLAGNESLEIVLDTIYLDTTPPAITYNTVVVNGVEQQILGETVSIGAVIRDIEVRCSATDSFSGIGTNDVHLSIGGASLVVSALDTSQVIDEGNQEGNPSLPALPPGNNNLPEEENGGVEEGAAEEEGKKGDSLDEVGDEESSREDQGRGDGGGADTFMAGAFGVGVLDVGTEVYSTLDYSATSTYSFDVGENTVSSGVSDRAGNYSEGSVVFSVEGVIENSYCYPVPLNSLSQVLKVAFSLEAANSIRVDIYNERAALIRTQTVLGELGNNVVTFSERLDNGLYLYQIVNLSKDSTLIGRGKFVVVNK